MILEAAAAQERVEKILGRMLTDEQGERFRAAIRAAHAPFIRGDDPLELRPAFALTVAEEKAINRQMAAMRGTTKPRGWRALVRWAAPWLAAGLALGAITDGIVRFTT